MSMNMYNTLVLMHASVTTCQYSVRILCYRLYIVIKNVCILQDTEDLLAILLLQLYFDDVYCFIHFVL